MYHRFLGLLVGLLCLLPLTAQAQSTDTPPTDAWRATYWNNPSLAGFARLQQLETADLDRDWANASPADGVNANYWSARWERTIQFRADTYRFTALADNGVRIWVDDELVVDGWRSQWSGTGNVFFGDVTLDGGPHVVRVEYYDTSGPALLQVTWARYVGPPAAINGWLAEYFNNATLSGDPVLFRDEAEIALNLQAGSPQAGVVNTDNFSARWTRTLDLPSGVYQFSMRVDDGGRLLLNGEQVLDGWRDQGPTTYTARINHADGPLEVVMEYYERSGFAVAELTWERIAALASVEPSALPSTSTATDPTPTQTTDEAQSPSDAAIVLNTGEDTFNRGGAEALWQQAANGYQSDFLWAANLRSGQGDYVWGRWQLTAEPGSYEIYVFVPESERPTSEARYWIAASGRYTLRIVDQARDAGRWVSLGVYRLSDVSEEYVSLSNVTGETTASTRVLWDALRLEPVR